MHPYRYVILGGGMVAGYAAQEMVTRGLRPGELAIISADTAPPYERPPLSKGFLAGADAEAGIFINPPTFYADHGIDLRLGTVVARVYLPRKHLHTDAGDTVGFDKLLIATGARVRRLDVPGAGLPGITYLRSLDDAKRIRTRAASATRVVVIGAGFIGMEVAAVLAQQGLHTTMVFPDERVWQRFFTPAMSAFFQRYYEERGVVFVPRARVTAFAGEGALSTVVTDAGRMLPADLVVAGIGVTAATGALVGADLALGDGVVLNEYLETTAPAVYAAGDVAKYYDVRFAKHRRVEHWDNAVAQGKHAARVMMGERTPFVHVPYFFSDVFDLSYECWGDAAGADEVAYRGSLDNGSFSVWWAKEGRLVAAFVLNRPDEERELAPRWVREGRSVAALLVQDEPGLGS
jgi:NADPH-dependent 2,4-dienoyl-CoA reductase/sulfur reductase-like enzyme